MKKSKISLLVICLILVFVAYPTTYAKSTLTVKDIIKAFHQAKMLIKNTVIYNEKTDTNNLLGRPGQYTGKVNFDDTRTDSTGGECTIEVFKNKTDLTNRKNYVQQIIKKMPAFLQYIYVYKNAIISIDKKLTPSQAEAYNKILKML